MGLTQPESLILLSLLCDQGTGVCFVLLSRFIDNHVDDASSNIDLSCHNLDVGGWSEGPGASPCGNG